MHGIHGTDSVTWRVTDVSPLDHHMFVLTLERGEGDAAETAYVDVEAFDDRRSGRSRLVLVGADRDAVSQSAAAWVDAQDDEALAELVLTWHLRRAS